MEYEDCTADDIDGEELIRLDMMYDEVRTLLKPDFIHEYVACYLQALHKYKFTERKTSPMYSHIYSCIQDFNCVNMNIVGKCDKNEWGGRITPQMTIEDYEIVAKKYIF